MLTLWFSPFVDAIYDCSSLYQKNYRISGVYKLPPDDFLGSPELEVRSSQPLYYHLSSTRSKAGDNRASHSLKRGKLKTEKQGFPGGAVVESPLADAGDAGSCPGLGGSHMPRGAAGPVSHGR